MTASNGVGTGARGESEPELLPKQRHQNAIWIALIIASLTAVFYPALAQHARNSADPWMLNDDARLQITPLLRFRDPALFRSDYFTDYRRARDPIGFVALYRFGARFIDPRQLSKVVPYLGLAIMLVAVALSTWRLGGPAAAWGSLALCLGADLYLDEMAGGLPRGFGYPLMAAAAAALVTGRPYLLAALVCLGASLYFPMGIVGGIALVLFLFLPPAFGGLPQAWTLRRRIAVTAMTGVLSTAIVLPNVLTTSVYGSLVGPKDWSRFPEAGAEGRLGDKDLVARQPLTRMLAASREWSTRAFSNEPWWTRSYRESEGGYRSWLHASVMIILIVGYGGLMTGDMAARRLLTLPLAGLAAYLVAWLAVPYLYVPERYLKFPVPVAVVVMLPAAVSWLSMQVRPRGSNRLPSAALTTGVCLALVMLFGGRGSPTAGLSIRIPQGEHAVHGYLSMLPPDVLLAGWPTTMDNVPYVTGRRVLLTHETHLPFHDGYLLEMRRRMEALIGAYFASEPGPLLGLRATFGVTHLVVDRRHYSEEVPKYFQPYDAQIKRAVESLEGEPETLRQVDVAGVFQAGHIIVLDLARISVRDK